MMGAQVLDLSSREQKQFFTFSLANKNSALVMSSPEFIPGEGLIRELLAFLNLALSVSGGSKKLLSLKLRKSQEQKSPLHVKHVQHLDSETGCVPVSVMEYQGSS